MGVTKYRVKDLWHGNMPFWPTGAISTGFTGVLDMRRIICAVQSKRVAKILATSWQAPSSMARSMLLNDDEVIAMLLMFLAGLGTLSPRSSLSFRRLALDREVQRSCSAILT